MMSRGNWTRCLEAAILQLLLACGKVKPEYCEGNGYRLSGKLGKNEISVRSSVTYGAEKQ